MRKRDLRVRWQIRAQIYVCGLLVKMGFKTDLSKGTMSYITAKFASLQCSKLAIILTKSTKVWRQRPVSVEICGKTAMILFFLLMRISPFERHVLSLGRDLPAWLWKGEQTPIWKPSQRWHTSVTYCGGAAIATKNGRVHHICIKEEINSPYPSTYSEQFVVMYRRAPSPEKSGRQQKDVVQIDLGGMICFSINGNCFFTNRHPDWTLSPTSSLSLINDFPSSAFNAASWICPVYYANSLLSDFKSHHYESWSEPLPS